MPYHVARSDECPVSKPWAVMNSQTGKIHGCHDTQASANDQMAALYANEPKGKAWTTFELKSLDDDARTFEGIASTPTLDEGGDIMEPLGAKFDLPMPLLWQHGKGAIKDPVGWITEASPGKNGIPVKGRFAKLSEPQSLKEELDRAWALVKAKLVRGLSIGWLPIKAEPVKGIPGATRYTEWSWFETSAVAIPMNMEASILSIKSIDEAQLRAVSGAKEKAGVVRLKSPAGVPAKSAVTSKGQAMTTAEHIASLEAKRAADVARKEAILKLSVDEGRTMEGDERTEFDTLATEVKTIDEDLVRLKEHQASLIATAKPVNADGAQDATDTTKGARRGIITGMKSRLEPGIRFTRYACSIGAAKGNLMQAEVNSRRFTDTPEVNLALKAAVAAGTTQDATWAAPLVQLQEMQSEFIEFLRPLTLLGRIPNLRRVPFNIKFTRQTAGTTGTFVGEGLPKPLGKMDFELLSLTWAKAATIIVMTEELVRFSDPGSEVLARDDLAAGIGRYLDLRFIDPVYAGVANVSPASITNGITPIASQGTTIALIKSTAAVALNAMIAANLDPANFVWLMNPAIALDLSLLSTSQDLPAFPNITAQGGSFLGYPVVTSNNVVLSGSPTESFVVLLDPTNIMLADDGGVSIDMSTEASLQMSDAPSDPATSTVNLWQSNMVALRAERFINWRRRRETAVQVITMNVKW
jgi:HK97 family phage major capsid protein